MNDPNTGIGHRNSIHDAPSVVGTSIIDQYDFVVTEPVFDLLDDFPRDFPDKHLLVERWDDNTDAGLIHHDVYTKSASYVAGVPRAHQAEYSDESILPDSTLPPGRICYRFLNFRPSNSLRKHLILFLKIVLSIALIWFAFRKIDLAAALSLLARIPMVDLAIVAMILVAQQFFTSLRLRQLVFTLGKSISVRTALDAVFIGVFFSQTFISFIGGDAMRVWRLTTRDVDLSLAARAVLLDRVAGFVALIGLIASCLPFLYSILPDPSMRTGLGLALALGLFSTIIFLALSRTPESLRKVRVLRLLADVSHQSVAIAKTPSNLFPLLSLSLVVQLMNVIAIYAIALGLNVDVTFANLLALIPPVLLLAMLPISFAGWGVREGAMVVALGLVGVSAEQSVAISVCFGLALIVIGLPGGGLWFFQRKQALAN